MGCNLRCPMCPVTDAPATMNGRTPVLMSPEVYRRILEQIADRPRSVLLTIFGEPFLHPRIVEFVELAKDDGHYVGLITNGTKLTRALVGRLIDARLDDLTMSVDGFTKQTYETLRVGARRDVVFTNLRELVRENDERGHPLRIAINYVVSSLSEHEQDDFSREFSSSVDQINFNPIADFGRQFEPPGDLMTESGDPRVVFHKSASSARSACIYLWRGMFVSAEGRMMLCCNDFKLQSALSSVTERPLLDIWRNEVERYRKDHVNGTFDSGPCASCRLNAVPVRLPREERQRIIENERKRKIRRAIVPSVLLSRRRRELRRLYDVPYGFLDFPLVDATHGGSVAVQGWSLACPGRTIQQVDVRVDGTTMGTAAWGYFRPDVGETHPGDGHSFCGFDYALDTRRLSNGTHVLEVAVTDTAAQTADFGRRSLVVRN